MSMKYNGSGYYDSTAYSALMDMAKAGEIWTSNVGKEFLILKNHGTLCSVLNLKDVPPRDVNNECIEIISRQVRWTNPAMIGYLFNQDWGEYVKTLPADEFKAIINDVSQRLGVTIIVQTEEVPAAQVEALQERCHETQERCDALYEAMERMQIEHEDEVARLKAAGDPAGAVYKQLYHELLDRIIAGGGTK